MKMHRSFKRKSLTLIRKAVRESRQNYFLFQGQDCKVLGDKVYLSKTENNWEQE